MIKSQFHLASQVKWFAHYKLKAKVLDISIVIPTFLLKFLVQQINWNPFFVIEVNWKQIIYKRAIYIIFEEILFIWLKGIYCRDNIVISFM